MDRLEDCLVSLGETLGCTQIVTDWTLARIFRDCGKLNNKANIKNNFELGGLSHIVAASFSAHFLKM